MKIRELQNLSLIIFLDLLIHYSFKKNISFTHVDYQRNDVWVLGERSFDFPHSEVELWSVLEVGKNLILFFN